MVNIIDRISDCKYINTYFSGMATIFMLHRVYPFESNKLLPNENMKISPEFLDSFIQGLKANGYEFISLDKLYELLTRGEKKSKQIVFTLDDGYADNYTHAYPIFKKHNVPFTIYITTSFPERQAVLWWYVLEDLIIENEVIYLSDGSKYICRKWEEKNETFLNIRLKVLSLKKQYFLEQLTELFSHYTIDWFKKCAELALNWYQIDQLSSDELVTIASHTTNHFALNKLSENEIIEEVIGASELLSTEIGKKIEHFAYPFGTSNEIGKREFDIVKGLNFKTVTTTRHGNIYLEHKDYLEYLPRIMLTESFRINEIGRMRRSKFITM